MTHQSIIDDPDPFGMVLNHFQHALRGPDTAYQLSHGLAALQARATFRGPALCKAEERDLLNLTSDLTFPVAKLFPDLYGRAFAMRGLANTAVLVKFCAVDPTARAYEWHKDDIFQAHGYVRVLRNACHNLDIIADLEARSFQGPETLFAEVKGA